MKRIARIFLALVLVCGVVSGCGQGSGGRTFKYDIEKPIASLDPQFATESAALTVIHNIFEGLVRKTPAGEISNGVCEGYIISEDGLVYTFTLRENATWWDGTPLVGEDFVFAFQRLFSPQNPSPYAKGYFAIKNSQQISQGGLAMDSLGVTAPDYRTVVFTLEREEPMLLLRLADSAAMPCKQSFFEETRGRYGLSLKEIRGNGAFVISSWDNTKMLQLRVNTHDTSSHMRVANGVNIYIGKENIAQRALNGDTDIALLPYETAIQMKVSNGTLQTQSKVIWCVVFNQASKVWGNPLLRQGLVFTVDREQIALGLEQKYQISHLFVPPELGAPANVKIPIPKDVKQGKRLFEMGLEVDEEPPSLENLKILTPSEHMGNITTLQKHWKDELSVNIYPQELTSAEIQEKFVSGDYDMLLMPFTYNSPYVENMLGVFTQASSQNYFGYKSQLFDQTLSQAVEANTKEISEQYFAKAQAMLLADVVIIPLYFERSSYIRKAGISGLQIYPFEDIIDFTGGAG